MFYIGYIQKKKYTTGTGGIRATLKRFKNASDREIPASREEGGFKIETVALLSVKALYGPTCVDSKQNIFSNPAFQPRAVRN